MTSEQRATLRTLAIDLQQNCEEDPRCGIQSEAITAALSEIDRINAEREVLAKGINTVTALIRESFGVYGLHQNGDVAPWTELESGGRFEEWLVEFDAARDLLATNKHTVAYPVPAATQQAAAPEMWLPSASDQEAMIRQEDEE